MKTKMTMMLFAGSLLLACLLARPATSEAGVHVSLGIQLPALAIVAPPALVVIPGTYAYYAPEAEAGLFFSNGFWYRPYQGGWFASVAFNGPWGSVAVENVPSAIVGFSSGPRPVSPGYQTLPYPAPRGNCRGGRGRGMGMMGMW